MRFNIRSGGCIYVHIVGSRERQDSSKRTRYIKPGKKEEENREDICTKVCIKRKMGKGSGVDHVVHE